MFRLRTDVPGANPTHAAIQMQPPTPTMATTMGMTPMGMPMGMTPMGFQNAYGMAAPGQALPLSPLKFIGLSGDGQPVYQHRPNPCSNKRTAGPKPDPNLALEPLLAPHRSGHLDPDSSRILSLTRSSSTSPTRSRSPA